MDGLLRMVFNALCLITIGAVTVSLASKELNCLVGDPCAGSEVQNCECKFKLL